MPLGVHPSVTAYLLPCDRLGRSKAPGSIPCTS